MTDDDYLTRVAVHGSISCDDVPSGVELTDEELDAVVEIVYVRERDEYRVLVRHHQTLFLDYGGGSISEFDAAREVAIETARDEGHPLLRRIYAWVPVSKADELGADRIPMPWEDDE